MKKPTKRQSEIMPLICQGYATKEIAEMLFISENTIKRHRMILMKKYKAKNVAHLVALWKDQYTNGSIYEINQLISSNLRGHS